MEMRSREDIDAIGVDLTPPLYPLAFSLYNKHLSSHCSACFSPLSSSANSTSPLYCSPRCSSSHSTLHHLSAADLLLCSDDSSDLRAALYLLHRFEKFLHCDAVLDRIGGLMTNREALLLSSEDENDEVLNRIREGVEAMAAARRRMRDRGTSGVNCALEEAALCTVLTNAVEVQDKSGCTVGIAIYDTMFSWINHSCSPNACYRFVSFTGDSPSRIAPATVNGACPDVLLDDNVGIEELDRYGPRIGLRSIKAIKKGEDITIAYTDLLQPKETRQSDVWLKYRFLCYCKRCSALPLPYVDHVLQDIHVASLGSTNLTSDYNLYRDEAARILSEYMDDAINEYLMFGNAASCCEKIENVLSHGLTVDQSETEGKMQQKISLQPLHHLSLNAYTALASAYKTLESDCFAINNNSYEHQLRAFDNCRMSAAYSLLLAGATHYLFLYESSLILSVANFWTAAGESLLSLVRSQVQNISIDQQFSITKKSPLELRCNNCALRDMFQANFVSSSHTQNQDFENLSREFRNCITDLTPQVWICLVEGAHCLREIKDPVDFTSLSNTKDSKVSKPRVYAGNSSNERSFSSCEEEACGDHKRIPVFQLGAHCLLFGEFLLKTCCGKYPHSAYLSKEFCEEEICFSHTLAWWASPFGFRMLVDVKALDDSKVSKLGACARQQEQQERFLRCEEDACGNQKMIHTLSDWCPWSTLWRVFIEDMLWHISPLIVSKSNFDLIKSLSIAS